MILRFFFYKLHKCLQFFYLLIRGLLFKMLEFCLQSKSTHFFTKKKIEFSSKIEWNVIFQNKYLFTL